MSESDQKEIQVKANLSRIRHRIMVMSGKGGVGKSFIAVNLAYGLALRGKNVGLLDADVHGPSIAKLTNIEGETIKVHPPTGLPTPIKVFSNLYVLSVASLLDSDKSALIWRGPLKMALLKQFFSDFHWEDLDYLIIDCPPGTGDEPLSIKQILGYVDGAVIVTTPQDIAILDVKKSVDFAEKLELPILGIIENMKYFRCPKCNEITTIFPGYGLEKMLHDGNLELLAELEIDPLIVKSSDEGKPYVCFYDNQPAAHSLQNAIEKVIHKIEKESAYRMK